MVPLLPPPSTNSHIPFEHSRVSYSDRSRCFESYHASYPPNLSRIGDSQEDIDRGLLVCVEHLVHIESLEVFNDVPRVRVPMRHPPVGLDAVDECAACVLQGNGQMMHQWCAVRGMENATYCPRGRDTSPSACLRRLSQIRGWACPQFRGRTAGVQARVCQRRTALR